jgi:hypothetical protein
MATTDQYGTVSSSERGGNDTDAVGRGCDFLTRSTYRPESGHRAQESSSTAIGITAGQRRHSCKSPATDALEYTPQHY